MTFDNPDFIIQKRKDIEDDEPDLLYTLRKYKGHDKIVTIPDGVQQIDDFAFADDIDPNNTIEKIVMPDSVMRVSAYALDSCLALKEIEFSKNIRCFYVKFNNCPNVDEIWIPERVVRLGNLRCKEDMKIHIGKRICEIDFSDFSMEDEKSFSQKKDAVTKLLLQNPAYKIVDGVMINDIEKWAIYSLNQKKQVNIPKGIEVIAGECFYELVLGQDMIPVEEVFIPASVETIADLAFHCCNSLKEVVYEKHAKDINIHFFSFFNCPPFHSNGADITFNSKNINRKFIALKFERLVFIHKCFKRYLKIGKRLNKNQLQEKINDEADLGKFGIATIGRDLEYLKKYFGAPIAYDSREKGYYYTKDFV